MSFWDVNITQSTIRSWKPSNMWVCGCGCSTCACVCTDMWRPEVYISCLPEMFSNSLFGYLLSMKLGLSALAWLVGQWAHISSCLCFEALELVCGAVGFYGSARNSNPSLHNGAAGSSPVEPSFHLQEWKDWWVANSIRSFSPLQYTARVHI